jgi:hypothetical protein
MNKWILEDREKRGAGEKPVIRKYDPNAPLFKDDSFSEISDVIEID